MSESVTTDNIRKLSEFPRIELQDSSLLPATDSSGANGGHVTVSDLRKQIQANMVVLTESQYNTLVKQNKVDESTFYFLYEEQ